MQFANCDAAFDTLDETEVAATHLAYAFAASGRTNGLAKISVTIDHERTFVELPNITWPNMTEANRRALAKLYEAFINHESGHLRIAEQQVRAITDNEPAIDLADFDDTIESVKTRLINEQDEYDTQSAHGIRQSHMPAPFSGPDTIMRCHEAFQNFQDALIISRRRDRDIAQCERVTVVADRSATRRYSSAYCRT